jgi:Leucine-rich repeat (LRR) protein
MLDVLIIPSSNISNIKDSLNKDCPVTEINLEHNELTKFPDVFSGLQKLQHLYLLDNRISGAIDLKNFKTLNQIDVGKNEIVDMVNIPDGIETLFLYENPITKIPEEVPNLTDLNELDLNSTKITEIPPNLFKLNKLSIFHISNNPQLSTNIINFG